MQSIMRISLETLMIQIGIMYYFDGYILLWFFIFKLASEEENEDENERNASQSDEEQVTRVNINPKQQQQQQQPSQKKKKKKKNRNKNVKSPDNDAFEDPEVLNLCIITFFVKLDFELQYNCNTIVINLI